MSDKKSYSVMDSPFKSENFLYQKVGGAITKLKAKYCNSNIEKVNILIVN